MLSQQTQRKRRLKDSCNSCAASKVKCSKNKPTCTRCEDRGISCQYVASQRSGRRSTLSSVGAPSVSTAITPPPEPSQFNPHKACSSTVTPSSLAFEANSGVHEPDLNDFADFPMSNFDNDLLDQWGNNFLSTPMTDGAVYESTALSPLATTCKQTPISHAGYGSVDHSLESGFEPVFPAGFEDLDFYRTEFSKDFKEPPQRQHSCLSLALDILPSLYIPPPMCEIMSLSPCNHQSFTIDYIISTNKKIIESISIMLDCPCSLDGQLAFVLALITLQVLAWYDVAAKDVDSPQPKNGPSRVSGEIPHLPLGVSKYQLDGIHDRRVRAQLILSELKGVVRFVELLSKRFEEARARAGGSNVPTDSSGLDTGGRKIGRLSASILVQLEADIKQRLEAVAKYPMAILRNG
ncbi:hypothetical protein MMC07_009169 [Pseudocyphellaria aurata]|nr:hypothetical protein [Pseudocyphellaria aurata]